MKEYIRTLVELLMTKEISRPRFVTLVLLTLWLGTLWLAPDFIDALANLFY